MLLPEEHIKMWITHEQAALASCLNEGDGVAADRMIEDGINTKYFYRPANKVIWSAMMQLRVDSKATDQLEVTQKLHEMNQLDAIGGIAYLLELERVVETHAHLDSYINNLRNYRKLYLMANMSMMIGDEIRERKSAEEIIISLNTELEKMEHVNEQNIVSAAEYIPIALQELQNPTEKTRGLKTGFKSYDEMTGGLKKQTFVVWAARPGMGKSTIAMNAAETVAVNQKENVLIFSVEMGRLEVGIRQICSITMLNQTKIKDKLLTSHQKQQLGKAADDIGLSNIYIDDSSDITPSRIAARARSMKNKHGLSLIIIDYLQIVTPDNPNDIREQQISATSRAFKKLASKLDVCVLCLAQLNRSGAKEEREPKAIDLRESGAIEQEADIVFLLHETEALEKDNKMKGIVGKQRNGETGSFLLDFHKYCFRFGDEGTLDDKKRILSTPTQKKFLE